MAKTKRKVVAEPDRLELKYDLFSLPTAQHKSGLAGLMMMIESMKARRLSPLPEVTDSTATGVKVTFTLESMQAVFDDLFAASFEEVPRRYKKKDTKTKEAIEPKREEKRLDVRSGKEKPVYIYDEVVPRGAFIEALSVPDIWRKLWRDMVWSTLRGRPTTRGVYNERADGQPSSVAAKTWASLMKAGRIRAQGRPYTEPLVSSVFVGAQDVNAEQVPFQGTPEDNLLLHFWLLPALIFAPRRVDREGKTESAGYALAIPEPADIPSFTEETKLLMRSLDPAPAGFRPKAAQIDLPAEGGLEYLHNLVRARMEEHPLRDTVAAVEVYHLEKRGNNIPVLAAERILPDERVLRDYERLRDQCRNPLYRSQRIANLLHGEPWHCGMDSAFNQYPREFFVRCDKTPRLPFFGTDARKKFRAIESNLKQIGGQSMTEQDKDDLLAQRVYRLVREYVRRRTEEKSGEKYENFKSDRDEKGRVNYPPKYREALERVSSDAFLAMRGRRDKDFVEYFTGTVCSVPQYLPEDEYLSVSKALTDDWSRVKTLAMLAVSACSYIGGTKDEKEES